MELFANVSVVNQHRGRLRLNIPGLYRAPQVVPDIEAALARHAKVSEVHANPLTARVLILFDPALSAEQLLGELALTPLQALSQPTAQPPAPPPRQSEKRRQQSAPAAPMYAPWHLREADEALAFFDSSPQRGLSDQEAAHRLESGANMLTQQKSVSSLEILINQFKSPPVVLLGVSAVISVATGGLAEAAAIAAVLVLNGGIGFVTERRAESTIASLAELIDDVVTVLRSGELRQVEAAAVVPGDVLVLTPGMRVAADGRLLEANGLALDESALTGESVPSHKVSTVLPAPAPLAERRNMAYRGTAVATGEGRALVVGTGDRTEVGAIQALSAGTERPKTPIQLQLEQLGNQLVVASSAACVGIFALGLLRGYNWLTILKTSLSLAIAAVPEGLPAAATTSLARGLRRMRERDVLMRSLHSVENIGAIDTICLDKTGTLTLNRMSAVSLRTVRQSLAANGPDGPLTLAGAPPEAQGALLRLLQVCILCNQAGQNGNGNGAPEGSPTESALLDLAQRAGLEPDQLRRQYTLRHTQLRAEGRNHMRTVHVQPDRRQCLIAVKGAPGEVLAMASHYLEGDALRELDGDTRDLIAAQNEEMAQRQLRVLGFAFAETEQVPDGECDTPALTWLGLVGMADPLRPGMERTIQRFHAAGIRTIMLTGDQATTAYEIGSALHLNNGDDINIVDSEQLARTAPEQLQALTANAHIFARVSPSHKLQIVRALQDSGRTVAMTGDGINDGPALRAADVGIAMGGGTDVALSVADIALKHDDLETLLDAVSQGRSISANIGKSLHFLLSSNLSEILVVLGGVVLGRGQPLTPLQLLWLNLLSDLLPAIALAAEPAEDDVMTRPPRPAGQPIVGRAQMWRYAREGGWLAGGALGAYLTGAARYGHGARAGTMAFNTMVLGQLLHAVSCRSERHTAFIDAKLAHNRELNWAIGGSLGLQVLANVVPGLRRLLGIVPMGPSDILVTLAGAGVPFLANEWAKGRAMRAATR